MRGLRIAACGVALATLASLTVGLLQVLEVVHSDQEDWIPLAIYPFLALAILSPAVVGLLIALQFPRNRIAWILLLGALLPALQIAASRSSVREAYHRGPTVPPSFSPGRSPSRSSSRTAGSVAPLGLGRRDGPSWASPSRLV